MFIATSYYSIFEYNYDLVRRKKIVSMNNKIKVVELFAGVGGFRLGLEGWNNKSATSGYKETFKSPYEIVWSNQWEPSTKTQHASMAYEKRKNGYSKLLINC